MSKRDSRLRPVSDRETEPDQEVLYGALTVGLLMLLLPIFGLLGTM